MFCVAPPELETKMNITKGGLVLFSANSNSSCMELSKKIAERLGVEMGKVQVYQEPNRETRVQIQESVREKMFHHPDCLKGCEHHHHGAPDYGVRV